MSDRKPVPGETTEAAARARVAELTRELLRLGTAVAAGITERSGMHATDVRALRVLDAAAGGEPVSVSRLGAELGLSSGAMTALVDRLEGHGMVCRVRDPGDRRRVHLELTEKARALGGELLLPIARRMEAALAGLDAEEAQVVARYLEVMADAEPADDAA